MNFKLFPFGIYVSGLRWKRKGRRDHLVFAEPKLLAMFEKWIGKFKKN